MTALQAAILMVGSFGLIGAATAAMIRVNRSERRYIERRRQEWTAKGSPPDEEPNFYSGSGGN